MLTVDVVQLVVLTKIVRSMKSVRTADVISIAPKIETVLRVRSVCRIRVTLAVVQIPTARRLKPALITIVSTRVPVVLPVELMLFVLLVITKRFVRVKRDQSATHMSSALESPHLVVHLIHAVSAGDVKHLFVGLSAIVIMSASIMRNVWITCVVLFVTLMTFVRKDLFAMAVNVRLAADQTLNAFRLSLALIENVLAYVRVLQLVEQMQSVMESIINHTVRVPPNIPVIQELRVVVWIVWLMSIVILERFAKIINAILAAEVITDVLTIKVVLVFSALIPVCLVVFVVRTLFANLKPINRSVRVRLHSREIQPFAALYRHKRPFRAKQTLTVRLTSFVFTGNVLQDMNAVQTKTVRSDTYVSKENVLLVVVVTKTVLSICLVFHNSVKIHAALEVLVV